MSQAPGTGLAAALPGKERVWGLFLRAQLRKEASRPASGGSRNRREKKKEKKGRNGR